jgi:hypothetical protein
MTIKVVDQVQDDLIEPAWTLYHDAFEGLNSLTVQRHLMYRSEFDDVMLDERVQKYLAIDDDDGALRGLSTYTNDLDAVPLISPQYFARRWPKHFAERRVWYCGFVAVQDDQRAARAFGELVEAMYLVAAAQDGIIGLDICRHNDDARRMSRVVRLMLHRLSGDVIAEPADAQTYWIYEFPNAA